MNLSYCPDGPLEPPERKDQAAINRYSEMLEAEQNISAFLEEYKGMFRDEIKSFLIDLRIRVDDEKEDDYGNS